MVIIIYKVFKFRPKFKYFIDNDDHMMRYDENLLDEIKKFISLS